jgi:TonB family protein
MADAPMLPDLGAARAREELADATPATDRGEPLLPDGFDDRDEEEDEEQDGATARTGVMGALARAFLSRGNQRNALVGTLAAILLLGALAMRNRGSLRADSPPADVVTAYEARTVSQTSDGRTDRTALAPTTLGAAPAPSASFATASPMTLSTAARKPEPTHRQLAPREREVALVAPSVRSLSLGNLDALTRSLKAPAPDSAAFPVHLAADDPNQQLVGSIDGPAELVRAQLIGNPPQPRFPEILRDRKIDGDVVVRFTVDAQGRPVPSSIVVLRTPHELLSDVVRRAIPSMRFEPAHRATIGAPAQPDEIQMSFQFSSGVK